jgi:hypothetical protein
MKTFWHKKIFWKNLQENFLVIFTNSFFKKFSNKHEFFWYKNILNNKIKKFQTVEPVLTRSSLGRRAPHGCCSRPAPDLRECVGGGGLRDMGPVGPYRLGPQPFLTGGPDLVEDPPTYQWVLPDLTCAPKDMKICSLECKTRQTSSDKLFML